MEASLIYKKQDFNMKITNLVSNPELNILPFQGQACLKSQDWEAKTGESLWVQDQSHLHREFQDSKSELCNRTFFQAGKMRKEEDENRKQNKPINKTI